MFVIYVLVFIFFFVYLMNYFMNLFVRLGISILILKVDYIRFIKYIKYKFLVFFLKRKSFLFVMN